MRPRRYVAPVLPPTGATSLRLTFEHLTGPLAGLHQILGHAPAPYPSLVGIQVIPDAPPAAFNLVRVRRGAVHYRELGITDPTQPQNRNFDAGQR